MAGPAAGTGAFYEEAYAPSADAGRHGRWRALSAEAKADHVIELAHAIGLRAPATVAEVGCGDGSVLALLGQRGFGARRVGFEIAGAAVEIAASRPELASVEAFDGDHVPAPDDAFDLVFATHVLEHVPAPARLLAELTRVGRAVVIEVPLEANLSARRPAARAASAAAGHIQQFDRGQVRCLVADAHWTIRAERVDPLPRAVHLFDRETPRARATGLAKWAVRRAAATAPAVGTRLFTMHYALIATPV